MIGRLYFPSCCSAGCKGVELPNARRRKEKEIKRNRNITIAMATNTPSEERNPVRAFVYFLTHLIPGKRMTEIPNMIMVYP